jgi:hypothetical protein
MPNPMFQACSMSENLALEDEQYETNLQKDKILVKITCSKYRSYNSTLRSWLKIAKQLAWTKTLFFKLNE